MSETWQMCCLRGMTTSCASLGPLQKEQGRLCSVCADETSPSHTNRHPKWAQHNLGIDHLCCFLGNTSKLTTARILSLNILNIEYFVVFKSLMTHCCLTSPLVILRLQRSLATNIPFYVDAATSLFIYISYPSLLFNVLYSGCSKIKTHCFILPFWKGSRHSCLPLPLGIL